MLPRKLLPEFVLQQVAAIHLQPSHLIATLMGAKVKEIDMDMDVDVFHSQCIARKSADGQYSREPKASVLCSDHSI